MTLTEFLLARIAEDEATAREAQDEPNARWSVVGPHDWEPGDEWGAVIEVGEEPTSTRAGWNMAITPAGGEHGDDGMETRYAHHMARHDPARVLAECEAKRRIVEHVSALARDESFDGGDYVEDVMLRDLAAVYADHPDYRPEWKP